MSENEMPKITNEEILKLQHVFGEIHTDHDPFSDGILAALDRLAELEAAMSPQPSRAQIAREFIKEIEDRAYKIRHAPGFNNQDDEAYYAAYFEARALIRNEWEAEEPPPCHHIIGIFARGNGAAIPVYESEHNERIDFRFTHCPSCGARLVTPDAENNE